ncbi:hypothetical protein, partial [Hansschlegelia zhihuaiae]|uniref:hypothetical protein n=1 Tax=Hansschlegelia zhihuaiae TaxID=405005 RepID=UPI0013E8ABF5
YVLLRAVLFTMWFGILLRWLPAVVGAIHSRMIEPGLHLSLGIWISFAGSFALGVFAMAQKWLDYPDEMRKSPVLLAILSVQLVGATMHLTSPGIEAGRVPARDWLAVASLLALGGGIAGLALVFAVDLG